MLLIKLSGTLEPMPTVYTTGSTAGAAAPAASGDGACPASNSAVRTRVPKPWRSIILALLIRFYRSCGVGRYWASGGDFTGDIQTRISVGTFSGCGARFSVPPQASACGEPARRAEARRSTLKRAPRGTSRPFTYTQMYSHRFFHMTKYTTTRATYVAAQNQGVHHAMPSMRKSEIGQRNRVA